MARVFAIVGTGSPHACLTLHTTWHRGIGARDYMYATDAGQPKRLVGPVATGDKVIARRALLDKLRADWPKLIGVEMEAGGAAAAAFQSANAPGFFMVRGVSDFTEHKGNASVDEWRKVCLRCQLQYTVALLKSGPVPPK